MVTNSPTKILPILVGELSVELPPEISNLQWKKILDISDESQVIQLLDEIQVKLFGRMDVQNAKSYSSGFPSFRQRVLGDLKNNLKSKDDYDYFEFFLQPLENPDVNSVMDVEKLLGQTVVDIKRWGGFNMPPFYQTSNNLKTIATQFDMRFHQTKIVLVQETFWQFPPETVADKSTVFPR